MPLWTEGKDRSVFIINARWSLHFRSGWYLVRVHLVMGRQRASSVCLRAVLSVSRFFLGLDYMVYRAGCARRGAVHVGCISRLVVLARCRPLVW